MGHGVPLLVLSGSPAARGELYGRAAAGRIRAARDHYRSRWPIDGERLRRRAMDYLPHLEAFDADLVEELRGIARGADLPLEDLVALNARNELLFGSRGGAEGCTVAAAAPPATADGHVYLAQNWDWAPELEHISLVLRIEAGDKPTILTFVDAGRVAMHGLNEAGLGLCGNYLETAAHPTRPGVPIPFLRRRVLQCESVPEAVRLLETTPRGTSSNYLIADRSGAIEDCEATAEGVFRLRPEGGVLAHTNHFCHAEAPDEDDGLARVPDSLPRLARARSLLSERAGGIDAEVLKRVLADHEGYPASICRHGDTGPNWATLASHVMDLTTSTMELAMSTPCSNDYRSFRL